MFRKSTFALIATLAILSFVLAACQPAVTPTPAVQVQTVVVEKEGKTIIITTTPAPTTPPPAQPAAAAEKKTITMGLGAGDLPSIDPFARSICG